MGKNSFVISDESINSHGYIIKTDGIDTTAFERNPVMLYMHERKTIVGRWENIRKEGNRLLADAVFDDSTELGKTVKAQVENGFLRSASIGIDIIEEVEIDGVKTVTKSVLFEVSIVDIPSNQNALKLYRKGNYRRFALEVPQKVEDLRTAIISLLGLDESATDEDIITEIQHLQHVPDEATLSVESAINAGYIDGGNRKEYVTLARINPAMFGSLVSKEKERRKKAVKEAVSAAFGDRRINYTQVPIFTLIGEKMGLDALALLLGGLNKSVKLSQVIEGGDRTGWMLEDYRKHRPDILEKNPKLYAELVEAEKQMESNTARRSLEYMRKHNPEYLKAHPEYYKQMVETFNNQ